MKNNYFVTALSVSLKLLLICAVIAGVVSFVFSVTTDAYNQNLENEKKLALRGIFAESESDVIDYETLANSHPDVNDVYLVSKNGTGAGFCVNITAKGFGGDMTLMIGYNYDGSIKGVQVISHAETPGVGTKALVDGHLSQYAGKSGELTIAKGSSADVAAVAGATISSKAIHAAINSANSIVNEIISNSISIPSTQAEGGIE